MKNRIFLLSLICSNFLFAQEKTDWFNQNFDAARIAGADIEKAYDLLEGKTLETVVVAVIDDGVDIFHEDLEGKVWTNEDEVPDNGIDDDKNGYVDDIHGWNFLGNPQGENIEHETLELTRLYRDYSARFKGKTESDISKNDKNAFKEYLKIKEAYEAEVEEIKAQFGEYAQLAALYDGAMSYMQEKLDTNEMTLDMILAFEPGTPEEEQVKNFVILAEREGLKGYIEEGQTYFNERLEYNYNVDFDPREIVNEKAAAQKGIAYGNPMVWAMSPEHGTHVAGIIAANRKNEMGIRGIASNALIMPLRAVPAGDERDKDIALAIRYAVDNGARIINMSFGKSYSPDYQLVEEAIEYAESNDVLLIHAAGNDASDNDVVMNYPNGTMGKKKTAKNFINVAANAPTLDTSFVADFSNYGRRSVDVFAPGVELLSLIPENQTKSYSGTSMAAPVVSGVAALVRGARPDLSAQEVKKILLKHTNDVSTIPVVAEGEIIEVKKIVRNPGVVSAYKAVDAALN